MIFSVIPGNPSEMEFLFGSVATAEKREVNAHGLLLHGLLLIVSILKKKHGAKNLEQNILKKNYAHSICSELRA